MPQKKNSQNASADNGMNAVETRCDANRPAEPVFVQVPNNVDVRRNPGTCGNEEGSTNQQATIIATPPLPANEKVFAVPKPPAIATFKTLPTSTETEQRQPVVLNPEAHGTLKRIIPSTTTPKSPTSAQLAVINMDVVPKTDKSLTAEAPTNQQATITSTSPLPVKETISAVQKPALNPIEPTLADRMRSQFSSSTHPSSSANEQPKQVALNPGVLAVSKPTIDRVDAIGPTPNVATTSRKLPIEIINIVAKSAKIVNKEVQTTQPPIPAPTQPVSVQPAVNPIPPPIPDRNRTRSLGTAIKSRNQPSAHQTELPSGPPLRPYRNPRDPFFYNRMSTRSVSKALQGQTANQEPQPDATNLESLIASKRVRARSVAARVFSSDKSAVNAEKDVVPSNSAAETAKPPAKKRGRPFKNKPPPPAVPANPAPETAPEQSLPESSTVPKLPVNRVQQPPSTRMRTRSLAKAAWLSNQRATASDAVPTERSKSRPPVETQAPMCKQTDAANGPSSSAATGDAASVDQQTPPEKMPTVAPANSLPACATMQALPANPPSPTPQQPVPTKRTCTPSVAVSLLCLSSTEPATAGNSSGPPQHSPKPLNSELFVKNRQRARSAVTDPKTLNVVQNAVTPNVQPPLQSPAKEGRPRRSSQSTTASVSTNTESAAPRARKPRAYRVLPPPPTRMHTRSFSKAAQSLASSGSAETIEMVQDAVTSSKEAIPPSVPATPDSGQPTPKERGRPFKNPQPANRIQPPPPTKTRTRSVSKALHLSQLAANEDAVPSGQQRLKPPPRKMAPMSKPTRARSTTAVILTSETRQNTEKEATCVSSTSTTPQVTMTTQQRLHPPPRKMAPMSKPTRSQSATRIPSAEKSQNVENEATCISSTSAQTTQATTTAPISTLDTNAPPVLPRNKFVMSKPKQPSVAGEVLPFEMDQDAKRRDTRLSFELQQCLITHGKGLMSPEIMKSAPTCSEAPPVLDPPALMPSLPPLPADSNRKRTHSIAELQDSSEPKRPNLATASPPLFNDNPSNDDFVFPDCTQVSSVNETVLPKTVEPAASSSPPTLTAVNQLGSTHPAPTSPPTLTPSVKEVVPVAQPSTDKMSEPPVLKRKRASPAACSPTSSLPKPHSPPKPPKSTSVPSGPAMTVELLNVTPLDVASIYANRPPATVEVAKSTLSESDAIAESADPPTPLHSIGEPSPPPVPVNPHPEHESADESDAEPKSKRWKYVPKSTPIMSTRLRVRKAPQNHSETPTPMEPKAKRLRSKSAAASTRKIPTSGKPDSQSANVPKTDTRRIVQLPPSGQKQKVQDAPTPSTASSKRDFEPAPRPPTPIYPEPEAVDKVVPKLAPSVHPKSGYDPHIIGELAESCWNAVLEAIEKEELDGVPVKPNYPCVMPWQRDPADPTFGLTPENIAARNKMKLPLPRLPGDTLPRSYLCPDGLGIITEEQYTRIVLAHNLAIDIGMVPQIRPASEPRQKVPAKKSAVSKTPKKKPVPAAKTPSRDQSGPSSMPRPAASNVTTKTSYPAASKASTNQAPGSKTPIRCHPVVIKPTMRNQQSNARPPAPLIRVPDRPLQGIVMVFDNNNDTQRLPPPAEILESRHADVSLQNARPIRPSNQQHPPRHARNPVQVGVPKHNQRDNSSSSDSSD